jgi:hypothetical protein
LLHDFLIAKPKLSDLNEISEEKITRVVNG